MTVDDISNIQILANLKNGDKLIGVTDDPFVLLAIAKFVKFVKVDESKFSKIPITELIR